MLLLIGGAPRAGKTRLAHRLTKEAAHSFVPTDALIDMVRDVAPELGLANWGLDKAVTFAPFLKSFAYHVPFSTADYVIEGDVVMPSIVDSIKASVRRAHDDGGPSVPVRACFLIHSDISLDALRRAPSWFRYYAEEQHEELRDHVLERVAFIRKECEIHNQMLFDAAVGPSALDDAFRYLTRPREGGTANQAD